MSNKTILALIVIVAIATVAIVSWRTPGQDDNTTAGDGTTTPTVVQNEDEDNPFVVTESPEATATPTVEVVTETPTPTDTPTTTPTPTTEATGFSENASSDWLYGVTEQTVGSTVYFISSSEPTKVMAGTSVDDASATTIYTSDNAGEISSFVVNGNSMYVVTGRDSSTNYSKFKKVSISNGSAARLWDFYSSKYSLGNFAVRTDGNTKAGFYLALDPVNDAYRPAASYILNYSQEWIKYYTTVDKTANFTAISPNTDATALLGLFDDAGSQVEGEIEL